MRALESGGPGGVLARIREPSQKVLSAWNSKGALISAARTRGPSSLQFPVRNKRYSPARQPA